jgi:hypothetical protein
MSYKKAKAILDDLYALFDRGELMQQFSDQIPAKDQAIETLEALKIDGYLDPDKNKLPQALTPKFGYIFALMDALNEFSQQLFHKKFTNGFQVYLEIKHEYLQNKMIPDDFLKRKEFLRILKKKMKENDELMEWVRNSGKNSSNE